MRGIYIRLLSRVNSSNITHRWHSVMRQVSWTPSNPVDPRHHISYSMETLWDDGRHSFRRRQRHNGLVGRQWHRFITIIINFSLRVIQLVELIGSCNRIRHAMLNKRIIRIGTIAMVSARGLLWSDKLIIISHHSSSIWEFSVCIFCWSVCPPGRSYDMLHNYLPWKQ